MAERATKKAAAKRTTGRTATAKKATKAAAKKQDAAEAQGAKTRAKAESATADRVVVSEFPPEGAKDHQVASTPEEAHDKGFYGYSPDPNKPEDYAIGGRLAISEPPTADETGAVEAPGTQTAAGQSPEANQGGK